MSSFSSLSSIAAADLSSCPSNLFCTDRVKNNSSSPPFQYILINNGMMIDNCHPEYIIPFNYEELVSFNS